MVDIDQLIESDGLFVTQFPTGQRFTWRLLNLREFSVFRGLLEAGVYHPFVLYNMVFDRCYVGDVNAINGNTPAGFFASMGELIMYCSGGADRHREEIEAARNMYPGDSVQEIMKQTILMAFPAWTPDVFDTWTRPRLLRMFTMAEHVLVKKSYIGHATVQGAGYTPLDTRKIVSSEEAAQAAANPVDFRAENKELNQAMGDQNHILDRHPDELRQKMATARKLDKLEARRKERIDRATRGN